MDPQDQVCHHPDCPDRGPAGRGNPYVHRHQEQRYRCRTWERTFAATTATPC
jgi:transposase-like protein